MSEINTNLTKNFKNILVEKLEAFASNDSFAEKMSLSFGEGNYNSLQAKWSNGKVKLPKIEVRLSQEIGDGLGAYSQDTNTIYLSQELVNKNNNLDLISRVLLEEYGHYIDAQDGIDALGDEGELFSKLVMGDNLSEREIESISSYRYSHWNSDNY